MTRDLRLLCAIPFLCAALAACADDDTPSPADIATLNDIRQRIQAAENTGQVDSMSQFFADDIVVMPPNGAAAAGMAANIEMMRGFFQTFAVQIEYTSQEIVVDDDWAFDRGTYRHTLTPRAGGPPMPETGRYLWLYHRAEDGSWKAARVIWNADAPPAATPPGGVAP